MNISGYKTIMLFFKRLLSYIVYFFTGLTACFFAFILVVNFLSFAVSEEQRDQTSQQERLTFKKIFGDIFKNLKTMLGETDVVETQKDEEVSQNLEEGRAARSLSASKEQRDRSSQQEKFTFKKIFGDIFKNLKTILDKMDVVEAQKDEEVSQNLEEEQAAKPPEELVSSENLKEENQNLPQATENFEGKAPGNVIPPSDQASGQLSNEETPPGGREDMMDKPEEGSPVDSNQVTQEGPQGIDSPPPSTAIPEVQSYMAPFIYESARQKDPFDDPTTTIKTTKEKDVKEQGILIVPKTPPEEYNLSEIKLRGVSWDTEMPKALFELPNNAGYYTLIRGDKIGKNGTIFEIRESEVVVVEVNYVGSGEERKEERLIKIKKMNRIAVQ